MTLLQPADIYLLQTSALGASLYATSSIVKRIFPGKVEQPDLPLLAAAGERKPPTFQPTRSIIKQLDQTGKPCMIFYGSQTGTAERFAHRFARDALERYNFGCVVADLDDYDFGDLTKLSANHLLVFILATYGEGQPTDNAIAFQNFLDSSTSPVSLANVKYSAFGLGSSSYTQYNAMIRATDKALTSRQAQRIGALGSGDDGKGTLEEDFSAWSESNLRSIAIHFSLQELPRVYRPAFSVVETGPSVSSIRSVYLGQPNSAHLYNRIRGPFTATNPFPAPITTAQDLLATTQRSCLHLEFDISGTSLSYDTGDHLAVLATNSNLQVHSFLQVFGLAAKKDSIIDIRPTDPTNKLPLPARTTYEAAARHYLDICTVVTRRMLKELSGFASSDVIRKQLQGLAEDKARFENEVTARKMTLSQLVGHLSRESIAEGVIDPPFSLILELFPRLRPRHYSISSSSLTSRKVISITAVVDEHEDPAAGISFKGVSTSYLSALKLRQQQQPQSTHTLNPAQTKPDIITDNNDNKIHTEPPTALIHVRRSKFRPPFDASVPIIMVGPGTGVAPFRAFVAERARQHAQYGRRIGRTLLFYGCRDPSQDFLYRDEWDAVASLDKLGAGTFEMHTAFSRVPGQPRQYVQDLLMQSERATEIRRLMLEHDAVFYVCGNAARMAKDVTKAMAQILSGGGDGGGGGGVGENGVANDGGSCIATLKRAGRWCEDVW